MLALAHNEGIKIGIGIWGALYYAITGIVTVYNGWKPSPQRQVQSLQIYLIFSKGIIIIWKAYLDFLKITADDWIYKLIMKCVCITLLICLYYYSVCT